MKSISIGKLRQNPAATLNAVEHGETYIVTRYRREVGRLVPPSGRQPVTADEYLAAIRATPLGDDDWAAEIAATRADFDGNPDPWVSEP